MGFGLAVGCAGAERRRSGGVLGAKPQRSAACQGPDGSPALMRDAPTGRCSRYLRAGTSMMNSSESLLLGTICAEAGAVATPCSSWQWEPRFSRLITRTQNFAGSQANSSRVS